MARGGWYSKRFGNGWQRFRRSRPEDFFYSKILLAFFFPHPRVQGPWVDRHESIFGGTATIWVCPFSMYRRTWNLGSLISRIIARSGPRIRCMELVFCKEPAFEMIVFNRHNGHYIRRGVVSFVKNILSPECFESPVICNPMMNS